MTACGSVCVRVKCSLTLSTCLSNELALQQNVRQDRKFQARRDLQCLCKMHRCVELWSKECVRDKVRDTDSDYSRLQLRWFRVPVFQYTFGWSKTPADVMTTLKYTADRWRGNHLSCNREYVMRKPSRCWLSAVPRYWNVVANCFRFISFAENTSAALAPRAGISQRILLLFFVFLLLKLSTKCCLRFFLFGLKI